MHCHLLDHEDMGMMAYIDVSGNNTVWGGAESLDPTCYRTGAGVGYEYTETTMTPVISASRSAMHVAPLAAIMAFVIRSHG